MKKILLLILDGIGLRENPNGNAITMANMPNFKKIMEEYKVVKLSASGSDVGLEDGMSGYSSIGHMAMGCARIIKSPYSLINEKIKDKSFFENDTLLDLMDYTNDNNGTLHLIGLLSDNCEYSSVDHFYAVLALAKIRKVKDVVFHFITDGKDSNQTSALKTIEEFSNKIEKIGLGRIGTICGRYYAFNNYTNHDRVKKVYDLITYNIGNNFADYNRCLTLHYKNNITDEFINPSVLIKGCNIKDGDALLFMNYKLESIHELVSSYVNEDFNLFNVKKFKNLKCACLYGVNNDIEACYSNEIILDTFGKYLNDLGFKQSRIAQDEKYMEVTYYFDGMEDLYDNNMQKILVPSSKVVRCDMKPEMNASVVLKETLDSMENDDDFILVNFTNPDSLAHTGNLSACIHGLESVDECLKQIIDKANENFYEVVITSSHGNCEDMKDSNGDINVSNTTNKVPFIILNKEYNLKDDGSLIDVIPTLIDMYQINKPTEMTGESLIIR